MRRLLLAVAACAAPSTPTVIVVPPVAAVPAVRELTVEATSYYERIHLHVRVAAPATPPKGLVVVIPGGPGLSHEYTLPLEQLVGAGYAVVTYDPRGMGKTSTPDRAEDQSADELAEDLDAIRRALHVDKVDVIAHSYGGVIAMAYASYVPDHVRSLIFVDSMPPRYGDFLAGQYYIGKAIRELQRQGIIPEQLPDVDGTDCSKDLIALLPVYYFDHAHPATTNLAGTSCNQAVMDATIAANANYDYATQLGGVTVPALVIQGEADPFTKQMADGIIAALTHTKAQLVMLPRCGHLPWEECPAPFFAAVRGFLSSRP